jgi:hypothetical protein
VFQAAGVRVIRTLVWNQRHLMTVLREFEDFYNTHRPHRTLKQAAPLRSLPDDVTDLDHFRSGWGDASPSYRGWLPRPSWVVSVA